MSADTSIEWTDRTWNPVRGCELVSPGCTNCYAMKQAHRFAGLGGPYEGLTKMGARGPLWTGAARTIPAALAEPLRWRKPQRVFVNSMSDLFHPDVPFKFVAAVFAVMAACPQHTFQILTKRPERMREFFEWVDRERRGYMHGHRGFLWGHVQDPRYLSPERAAQAWFDMARAVHGPALATSIGDACAWPWPLPNVWLGVSVEDQRRADERIPHLLNVPAAVRFLSCEPLLGPVVLHLERINDLGRWDSTGRPLPLSRIDWVIVGGESGPGARPFDVAWARSLVHQCREASVPVFVKQMGADVRDRNDAGFEPGDGGWWLDDPGAQVEHLDEGYQGAPVRVRLRDRKGGDPAEWPEDLRVREFPTAREVA